MKASSERKPFPYFRLHEYSATHKFVSEEKYQEEKETFSNCITLENTTSKFSSCPDPIVYKEQQSSIGKCFYLYTQEMATTEQKFQGCFWKETVKDLIKNLILK